MKTFSDEEKNKKVGTFSHAYQSKKRKIKNEQKPLEI